MKALEWGEIMGTIQHLNFDWRYTPHFQPEMLEMNYADQGFLKVHIPHAHQEIPYNYFDEKDLFFECCYRKHFEVGSHEVDEKRVLLHFDGVMTYARVFLNSQYVGAHKGGYTPFALDVTEAIHWTGENVLAVYVDARELPEIPPFGFVIDYLTYGGIYREVRLEYVQKVHLYNCHIQTKNVLEAEKQLVVDVYADNLNEHPIDGEMVFRLWHEQTKVHEFRRTLSILPSKYSAQINSTDIEQQFYTFEETLTDVNLWQLDNPELYLLEIIFQVGEEMVSKLTERFGFRQMNYQPDGFFLNGKRIKLRGLNRHQSFPYVGYAMPKSAQYKDAEILKYELGVNTVRLSHYPQSNHFMDRCDELGLLVFDEIPGWQHIGPEGEWQDLAKQNVREMIMKDWNHPSVFIWGVRINESKDSEVLYRQTNQIAHELDPTRVTGGVRYLEGSQLLEDVYTFNDFSHTGQNSGLKTRAQVAKKQVPYLVTEFNGHMFPTKKTDSEPHRLEHALRHLRVLDAMYQDSEISGAIGWCMFDYNTHKDFGSGDKICYHGVMDMFRIPKYAAYVYASQQSETPVLEVANAMEIGDFPGSMLGETYIFTNCDCVKVYKNETYIDTFLPSFGRYKGVPHPPVIVDSYLGRRIHDGEVFKDKDADFIKCLFTKISIHGQEAMSFQDKVKLASLFMKYKMKFSDGYAMFGKYMGTWGTESTTYKYEGYKNDVCVLTQYRSQLGSVSLKVKLDAQTLMEAETYDTVRVIISVTDQNEKPLPYCEELVLLETIGPIEIIGPTQMVLIGGSRGVWIKSLGLAGEAQIKVTSKRFGSVIQTIQVQKN